MDDRKQKVLLAIIQDYVATAEPVGSRTIARKYQLGVSPATIRNEMADLEEMGYIEQPHTSAGRVPSIVGYRYYVDSLMKKEIVPPDLEKIIREGLERKVRDVGEIMHYTGQLLAKLTSYAALVMMPGLFGGHIRHIQLVPLVLPRVTLVVVMDSGTIKNHVFEVEEDIGEDDLSVISTVLNAKLRGMTVAGIRRTVLSEINLELSRYRDVLNRAMEALSDDRGTVEAGKIHLDGMFNILNQPEFHNVEKVKTLLTLLEQEDVLKGLLSGTVPAGSVTVRIGSEMSCRFVEECSMVSATFRMGGQDVGILAVLGPTRMEYARVVSLIEFATRNLSLYLNRLVQGREDW
ncbi:MAG TPA: heat-inducible transcriptional repressor HrcA [Spirochaetia bacterium]|nr:heat-inducible transcriptional repressor HrcA [Spirochaetia bacterium]